MSYPTRPVHRPTRRTVRTRTAAAATLAGVLLTATGCGSSDESPQAAGTRPAAGPSATATPTALDPCGLISGDELDALAGSHLEQEGPATTEAGGRACRWAVPDAAGIGGAELVVSTWRGREFYRPGTIGPDEPGIGEEAQADRSLGMVLFRSGEDVVATHVLATPAKELALEVARAIVGSLGG